MTNWVVSHTDRFKAAVTMLSTCNRMTISGLGRGRSPTVPSLSTEIRGIIQSLP
jgi:hypothetical protein